MKRIWQVSMVAALALLIGCSATEGPSGPNGPTGTLSAALTAAGPYHDVEYIHVWLVAGGDDCDAEAIDEATVPLEAEFLPDWIIPGAGDAHPFGDALFSGLEPGSYTVCAQPLDGAGEPSMDCAPTSGGAFDVFPGGTTEIALISQCEGDPSGALDAIVALNDPPRIDHLSIEPSKFIDTCEPAHIYVEASDPNNDPLTYEWQILDGPADADYMAEPDGDMLYFKTCTPGTYTLGIIVTDFFGASTGLAFPLHVTLDPYPYEVSVNGGFVGKTLAVMGSTDVSSFYSYGAPDSASANTGLEESDTALAFIYEADDGALSLVIILDETQAGGDTGGGSADVLISGLGNAALAVPSVGDDNPGNDFYTFDAGAGTLGVDWQWSSCCTDGLAITFEDKFVCVDIDVADYTGLGTTWKILSGDGDGGILALEADVLPGDTLRICHCLSPDKNEEPPETNP